jgi:hypothetical protein
VRFLDQRPVLAGIVLVAGLGVIIAAFAFAKDVPGVLAIVIAFAGAWCASDGARSLVRVRQARRSSAAD